MNKINTSNEFLRGDLDFTDMNQAKLLFACLTVEFDGFYEKIDNIDYEFEMSRYSVQKALNTDARGAIAKIMSEDMLTEMRRSGFLVREQGQKKVSSLSVFDKFSFEESVAGGKASHVFKYRFASSFAKRHLFVKEYHLEHGEFPKGVSGYAEVDIEIIAGLRSICACSIYLKACTTLNEGMNAYSVELDRIKDNLNYNGEYRYFKRDVVVGLQKTLLKHNLKLDFKEVKKGKKVYRIEFKMSRIAQNVEKIAVVSSNSYDNHEYVQRIADAITKVLSQDPRYSDVVCSYAQSKTLLKRATGDGNVIKEALRITLARGEKQDNIFGYLMGTISNIVNYDKVSNRSQSSVRDTLNNQEKKIYDYVKEAYGSVSSEDVSRIRLINKKFYASTVKKAIQECCIKNKDGGLKYVQEQLLLGVFGKQKVSKKKNVIEKIIA